MSELYRFSYDTQNILNKTRLPSGGFINLWLNTGHYEVTQEAAERFGFSSAAVDILRDAAQDPDFYEFTIPLKHCTPGSAEKPYPVLGETGSKPG